MAFQKGHPQYNTGRTHFKKGIIPWNKGKRYSISKPKKRSIRVCKNCGKEFEIEVWRLKDKRRGQFCSIKCNNQFHSGKNHWAFGKKRPEISGKNNNRWIGGRPNCIDCGKKLSIYDAIRCQLCNLKFHSGKNHYNWQGGKSFEPYGLRFDRELKEQIRKRDEFKCQECGYTQKQLGYKLTVHHIDYNKQNNNPNNLISLCRNCHCQTNFSREDWLKYFDKKLKEGILHGYI